MATSNEADLREEIIAVAMVLADRNIIQGMSGNISVRFGDGFLITPTSIPYNRLQPEEIVWMDFDGAAKGCRKPSSEWRFHLDIQRTRADVGAVIHAHSPYCTALAIMGRSIPAIHYMIAAAGGPEIRCAPYATYGTQALSDHVMTALEDRTACLMAHHGMIAMGGTLERAAWLAVEVEALARQYHACLQIGSPPVLPDDEIERIRLKFAGYGMGSQE